MSLFQRVTFSDAACTVPLSYEADFLTDCTATLANFGYNVCIVAGQASVKVSCETVMVLDAYIKSLITKPSIVGMLYSDETCLTEAGFFLDLGMNFNKSLNANGKFSIPLTLGSASFAPNTCTGVGQVFQLPGIASAKVYEADVVTSATTTSSSTQSTSSSVAQSTTTSVGPNASTRSKAISIVALLPMVLIGMFAIF